MSKKMTTEEFIAKAKEVHGNKYDYSKTVYVDASTKVCVTCPEHGDFYQLPGHHLKGHGCKKCAYNIVADKAKMTTEEFIAKAKKVHNNKYDYSKVVYKNAHTKVCIICPEHGEFWQTPSNHIKGNGCPKCIGKDKTTEDFIAEAKKIHGDKYNYSKAVYKGATEKICIICPKHGEFWQDASSHISGRGCPECAKEKIAESNASKKLTTEEFVTRLKSIYGDKYDYSKVEYNGNKTKACIICPKHGEFFKTPSDLLRGQGCPRCNKSAKNITTEEFIARAKEVHGDKYDYSKTVYTKSTDKVCIICPEHGEFWQTPSKHLNGAGCVKCINPNAGITTEEFIAKAKEVHGDKYDYSKVNYKDTKTKVCIICPVHGEFWQTPSLHLKGHGCQKCGTEKLVSSTRSSKDEFIAKANEVHGNKYDYSKVNYVNSATKVCIICPEHGEFWQTPTKHISGAGCPKCLGRSKTTEDFIAEARKVHGDKYDYSKVDYKTSHGKVCIICHEKDEFGREHGEFWQTARDHLRGLGCSKCSGKYKMTTKEFVETAKLIHGDKYDYTKAVFNGTDNKVCIICPEHGEFWQIAYHHLHGVGCPNCSGLRKEYKFNLLHEFVNENEFRVFLANNDVNILQLILGSLCELEPKYAPLERDIQRALANTSGTDPIEALELKYSTESDDETESTDIQSINTDTTQSTPTIDLDNDEEVYAAIAAANDETTDEQHELSIEDVIRNDEQELQVINKIEHMLTPEIRKKIMKKYLNDKRRAWMVAREK